MLIDSHAHLTSKELSDKSDELILAARENGVDKIINICTDERSLQLGIKLARKHPNCFNTASTTPHDVEKEGKTFFPHVKKAAEGGQLVAIGETGLDYYYEHSPKELQKEYLKRYVDLAMETKLPLVIHCRDAFDDLFQICDANYNGKLLLHCFTGSLEEAKEVLKRGWMLSVSGIVTFKKSTWLQEVAKIVPDDQLLIETDSPYLAPVPMRGKENQPAFVKHTAEFVAILRGQSLEHVASITSSNANDFFSLA